MKRFLLTQAAIQDLTDLDSYLEEVPVGPAKQIAANVQAMIQSIAEHPYLGALQSEYTRLLGEEVRSLWSTLTASSIESGMTSLKSLQSSTVPAIRPSYSGGASNDRFNNS